MRSGGTSDAPRGTVSPVLEGEGSGKRERDSGRATKRFVHRLTAGPTVQHRPGTASRRLQHLVHFCEGVAAVDDQRLVQGLRQAHLVPRTQSSDLPVKRDYDRSRVRAFDATASTPSAAIRSASIGQREASWGCSPAVGNTTPGNAPQVGTTPPTIRHQFPGSPSNPRQRRQRLGSQLSPRGSIRSDADDRRCRPSGSRNLDARNSGSPLVTVTGWEGIPNTVVASGPSPHHRAARASPRAYLPPTASPAR